MSIVSDLENYLAWVEGASSAARVAALMYFDFDFNAQRQKFTSVHSTIDSPSCAY